MMHSESIRFRVRRNGADYGEIYPANNSAPTLRTDINGKIKMSLKGNFLPYAFDANGSRVEVDWLKDEIKPILIKDGIEHSLGVLLPSTVNHNTDSTDEYVEVEAYDRSWRVKDTRRSSVVFFEAGTPYLDAIEALVVEAGIDLIARTETDSELTEDREDWNLGDSNLDIVNQLLSEINYKELWFDSDGAAVLQPENSAIVENIQHVLTDKKPDPRNPKEIGIINIFPKISRSVDIYNAPNVYICICSNADKSSGMVAMAENTSPTSPLSIFNRGRRIVEVEQVSNIASQEELQAYADNKVSKSISMGEQITVITDLQPGFGVGDITALQTKEVTGICVESSWSMELKPGGNMTHSMERVVYNIG